MRPADGLPRLWSGAIEHLWQLTWVKAWIACDHPSCKWWCRIGNCLARFATGTCRPIPCPRLTVSELGIYRFGPQRVTWRIYVRPLMWFGRFVIAFGRMRIVSCGLSCKVKWTIIGSCGGQNAQTSFGITKKFFAINSLMYLEYAWRLSNMIIDLVKRIHVHVPRICQTYICKSDFITGYPRWMEAHKSEDVILSSVGLRKGGGSTGMVLLLSVVR